MSLPVRVFRPVALLLCLAGTNCRDGRQDVRPAIEFTTVPPAARGGSERMAAISGRVVGARAGHRVVLYAKSQVWWVQPYTKAPFTSLQQDGSWQSTVHLGTEYAALVVDAGFRPAPAIGELPRVGGSVVAVATVTGRGPAPAPAPRTLTFSGYAWEVRDSPSDRGGANDYDPANAWTDDRGRLHLKLARRGDRWTSAEVVLTRSLGYGTYVYTVADVSRLDPSAALGLFTWDDDVAAANHREMAIELSRWGDPRIANAQYVLQPFYVAANVARFVAPPGTLTHVMRWEPGRVTFSTARESDPRDAPPVARREFSAGVPTPAGERVRMNLYYFRHAAAPPRADVEVVIERFRFLP